MRWPAVNRQRPDAQWKAGGLRGIVDGHRFACAVVKPGSAGVLQLQLEVARRSLIFVVARAVRRSVEGGGDPRGADRTVAEIEGDVMLA